jgi:uncharacterized membrane protein
MPSWALALFYWLHLIATVIWVGGLTLLALVVWPSARARLGAGPELNRFLNDLHRRFNPWAWGSLAVLVGTGLMQMSADSNYHGLLNVDSAWAAAILAKHLAVLGMVLAAAAMQGLVQPEIARLALLEGRGQTPPAMAALRRREARLMWLNLGCALVTLACTAIATAL